MPNFLKVWVENCGSEEDRAMVDFVEKNSK